jgi:hypothetical protein
VVIKSFQHTIQKQKLKIFVILSFAFISLKLGSCDNEKPQSYVELLNFSIRFMGLKIFLLLNKMIHVRFQMLPESLRNILTKLC